MKAIRVDIYRSDRGDCSNGGISSMWNQILLLHDDGYVEVDEERPPQCLCKVVTRIIGGQEYKHIEPVNKPIGIGWMSGGCVCYSCDSRFRDFSDYPLCLHDRQESVKEYELLSR